MGKKSRFITILITCCICFGSLYTMASAKSGEEKNASKVLVFYMLVLNDALL